MNKLMVMDAESIGIMGEAFAVGYVLLDPITGEVSNEALLCCPQSYCRGNDQDRKWIINNVPLIDLTDPKVMICHSPDHLCAEFWKHHYVPFKRLGGWIAADVPFPVETNFLSACIKTDCQHRLEFSPYPIIDVASVRYAAGLDPLKTEDRLLTEQPAHNPLNDARQSARLLYETLKLLRDLRPATLNRDPWFNVGSGPIPLKD